MPKLWRNFRARSVNKAQREGHRRYQQQDLAGAIAQYQQACLMVLETLAADPADEESARQLAAMQYTLGQWHVEAGLPEEAVRFLDEAEGLYAQRRWQAAPLFADAVILRAHVHAGLGARLTAIEDVQQAVAATMMGFPLDFPGRALHQPRVIGTAASVLLRIEADPDLACAAANFALIAYQEELRGPNGQWNIPAEHVPVVTSTARVAAITHAAAGRGTLAGLTRQIAETLGGGPWTDFDAMAALVRDEQPALAPVLRTAGHDDLAARLTVPLPDGAPMSGAARPLAPDMRGDWARLPQQAAELAAVQAGDLAERAKVLLGLEAHAMFAAASRRQRPEMREQLGEFGPRWARTVLTAGRLLDARGQRAAARDAAGWLAGICRQLQPFGLADPAARGLVLECLHWSRDVHPEDAADGELTRALQLLEVLPPLPGAPGY